MPPERFQPKNDKRGANDCRPEHYLQGDERLILARGQPGQLLLYEIQFVHDLFKVVAGLGRLAEGEAFRVEVIGHVPITKFGVVNDRFTATPQAERRHPRNRGSATSAKRPGPRSRRLGDQPGREQPAD